MIDERTSEVRREAIWRQSVEYFGLDTLTFVRLAEFLESVHAC